MRTMVGAAQHLTGNPSARDTAAKNGRKATVGCWRFCVLCKQFWHNFDEMLLEDSKQGSSVISLHF